MKVPASGRMMGKIICTSILTFDGRT